MANIDDLRKRKEELELQRDIARLEREARVAQNVSDGMQEVGAKVDKIAKWSWYWVFPVTLLGAFALFLALNKSSVGHFVVAALLLVPIAAKLIGKR